MSSELIYRMAVVKLPAEQTGHYNDAFLWIVEMGSSNCFESRTGRRSRDWTCLSVGHGWNVMREVCMCAGDCEGGMIKYPGGRSCTPEKLILAYRNAARNAIVGFAGAAEAG